MLNASLVVNVRNEEANLPTLLESVRGLFAEILVVDMESDDGTVEIAHSYGARVEMTPRVLSFDKARKDAVLKAKYDWIVVLDADEELSPALAREIAGIIEDDRGDVVYLPFANLALSGFARRESGFPEYHMRVFKRSMVDLKGYEGRIHTFFQPLPHARKIKVPGSFPSMCVRHYTNPTVSSYLIKLDRYTTIEASERVGKYGGSVKLILHLFLKPLRAFSFHYVLRRGFLDGWQGFWQSLIFVIYDWLVLMKVWEIKRHSGSIPSDDDARRLMREHVLLKEKDAN